MIPRSPKKFTSSRFTHWTLPDHLENREEWGGCVGGGGGGGDDDMCGVCEG